MQTETNFNDMTLDELIEYRLDLVDELNELNESIRTIKHHLEYPVDDSKERRIRTSTALRYKHRELSELTLELSEVKAAISKKERMTFMEVARRMLEPDLFEAIQLEAKHGD